MATDPGSRSAHYWSWNPVRAAFWATLPEERRRGVVDLDWHSLRHFCGWYFYVHLGFTDELTAYQLGHSDAKLIRDLYGHGRRRRARAAEAGRSGRGAADPVPHRYPTRMEEPT